MAILEKVVEIIITNNIKKHYIDLGYNVIFNTPLIVKVEDLKINSGAKVTKICDDCGKEIPNQKYSWIIRSRKVHCIDLCKSCVKKSKYLKVDYENSLEYFSIINNKKYIIDQYSNENNKNPKEVFKASNQIALWNCPDCKSEYSMEIDKRTIGNLNCPYCYGRRANHTNSLWVTHPEIAKLLFDKELVHKITKGHNGKVEFKCNNCNKVQSKNLNNVTQQGFTCLYCSDGISYPEKFVMNLLDQININYMIQHNFPFIENKYYDFYIPSLNCIIETHGIQHFSENVNFKRSLIEEQENDKTKKEKALKNGVYSYVIIDCRFSDIDFIKKNIIKSELNRLIDLSSINWIKCHEFACSSLVKKVSDMWNNGVNEINKLSQILKINKSTITSYLKKGNKLGLCKYDPKNQRINSAKNNRPDNRRSVIQLSVNGDFIKEWKSITEACTKLNTTTIWSACNGKVNIAVGYRWMYKDDYEKNKKSIKPIKQVKNRPVVQISKTGEFIKHWNNSSEIIGSLGINKGSLSSACLGKLKTSGGYKWMYKEDYDKLHNVIIK